MSVKTWVPFRLEPDDVLFFRDGKPSTLGSDHYLRSLFPPYPSTLYGALRTRRLLDGGVALKGLGESTWRERLGALTAELGEWGGFGSLELRGPWMVLDGEVLLPAPADLGITLKEKKSGGEDDPPEVRAVARFRPLPPEGDGGWSHPLPRLGAFQADGSGWRPWPRGQGEPRSAEGWYLRPTGLEAWRWGGVPAPEDFVHPRRLWAVEARTGVGLQDDLRTSRQGRLYTFGFIRLLRGVALGFEAAGSALQPEGRVRLGGEGRTAMLGAGAEWPPPPEGLAGERLCLSLVTPALSKGGGYPPGFGEGRLTGELGGRPFRLAGAVLPGFVTVGGWDLARGRPKPLRRAIPPGSVFLFEPVEGEVRPAEFDGISLSEDQGEGLARQGFGLAVAGLSN